MCQDVSIIFLYIQVAVGGPIFPKWRLGDRIFENRSLKWVWDTDDAGGGCNVAVPNLPLREVG